MKDICRMCRLSEDREHLVMNRRKITQALNNVEFLRKPVANHIHRETSLERKSEKFPYLVKLGFFLVSI